MKQNKIKIEKQEKKKNFFHYIRVWKKLKSYVDIRICTPKPLHHGFEIRDRKIYEWRSPCD